MNREEFTEKLQRALAGGLDSSKVAENITYYREYIDSEVRRGRSEQEVLESLGDPRLLAKSIIEANKRAGASYGSNLEYDEEAGGGYSREYGGTDGGYSREYGGYGGTDGTDGIWAADGGQDGEDSRQDQGSGRVMVLPGWLVLLIVTVIVIVLIGLATALLSVFAPVIIVVLGILLIVKFVEMWRR